MKIIYAAVGLAGLLAAGSANAGPGPGVLPVPAGQEALFSSFVTNSFDTNSVALHAPIAGTQGGSPVAQQFTAPGTETLLGVTFELAAPDSGSGAAALSVFLVQNGPGNLPLSSGITLDPSSILLGTIASSSIGLGSAAVTLAIDQTIAAGTYWIALESDSTTTSDEWFRTGDLIGLNVGNTGTGSCTGLLNTTCGLFNAHVPPAGTTITSTTGGSLELQLDVAPVPEPASLALLGVGLAGVGFIRRRRTNKSAG